MVTMRRTLSADEPGSLARPFVGMCSTDNKRRQQMGVLYLSLIYHLALSYLDLVDYSRMRFEQDLGRTPGEQVGQAEGEHDLVAQALVGQHQHGLAFEVLALPARK